MADQDYSQLTVKQLKELIHERNIITINATRKADFVKALKDDDHYNATMESFQTYVKDSTNKITETKKKLEDTTKRCDDKIKELKQKDGKTIEDYEKLVQLLESRIKLAGIRI